MRGDEGSHVGGGPQLSENPENPSPKRETLAAAGIISVAVMASRVLGVLRESLRAALLGAGFHGDAFVIAYRIPNLLRDLFAEGALSAAFVPTFTDFLMNRSREEAHRLAGLVMAAVFLITGSLALLGIYFAPQLVSLIAPGFAAIPGKAEFAAQLTAIMMPFLPLVALSAVLMGMLNAQRRFFVPALAPALFNVVSIIVAIILWFVTEDPAAAAVGWSFGVLAGGAAQLLAQVPSLWRLRFRFVPALRGMLSNPGVRRIARLMAPAVIGLGAVQISIFVNSIFASRLGNGPLSWLDYAFRLYYLPIGLFGVALGTVTQTNVAEDAARGDREALRAGLAHSLRLVMFLTVPATIGLVALARPIVSLLFEWGRFTASDAEATSYVLSAYVFGLVAVSSVKVLVPLFYALDRPGVPLIASVCAVCVNVGFNWWSHRAIGAPGIALGMALGSLTNMGMLLVMAGRQLGGWRGQGLLLCLAKTLLASVLIGLLARWGAIVIGWLWLEGTGPLLVRRLTLAFVPIILAVLVYLPYARRIGIEEVGDVDRILEKIRRRLPGGRSH